jgi:hypothetical protein
MGEWVLILVVYFDGVAVTSVPGFTSAEACLAAGKSIDDQAGVLSDVSFSCVQKDGVVATRKK